jgi:hypothetical protein
MFIQEHHLEVFFHLTQRSVLFLEDLGDYIKALRSSQEHLIIIIIF